MSDELSSQAHHDEFFQTAEALRLHLMKHTVAMSFSKRSAPNPSDWIYATGFLLRLDGKYYLVTVKHWVEELLAISAKDDIDYLVIRYRHSQGGMTAFRMDPSSVWRSSSSNDVAWMEIPGELLEALMEHESRFFEAANAQIGPFDGRYMAVVGGYPTALIETSTEQSPLLYFIDGKVHNHVIAGLSSIAFLTTCVSPRDAEEFTADSSYEDTIEVRPTLGKLCSNPEVSIDSAVGISGGPVVCFRLDLPAQATPELQLLAMQFSQIKVGDHIRRLKTTSVRRIIDEIRRGGSQSAMIESP